MQFLERILETRVVAKKLGRLYQRAVNLLVGAPMCCVLPNTQSLCRSSQQLPGPAQKSALSRGDEIPTPRKTRANPTASRSASTTVADCMPGSIREVSHDQTRLEQLSRFRIHAPDHDLLGISELSQVLPQ